jgi:ATP-dependent phosphofructokinase / diphosphate-dependent phosphofructokinase
MTQYNAFYAQSGGPTAVINATACGLIHTARAHQNKIGTVYAGRYGILGALREQLIDTQHLSNQDLAILRHTPGAAFGSCRYKLNNPTVQATPYRRILSVFKAHHIRYFFYNGGGDSQDTTNKLATWMQQQGYPLTCIGLPKTIDNDLPLTHNCPGFGSTAKYVATTVREASLDVASMCESSTKVFVLEVMGRHSGWIAAAAGLAAQAPVEAPHVILFPEVPFIPEHFLKQVAQTVKTIGFCSIVASEGIRDAQSRFLSDSGERDAFGHQQLGGVALQLAQLIKTQLGIKTHWAVLDYCQRAAAHMASQTDLDQAYALGQAAVAFALKNQGNILLSLAHAPTANPPWTITTVPLQQVANQEKTLPKSFISENGFQITPACRTYLLPLIQGEAYPPYSAGLPDYFTRKLPTVPPKLPPFSE